MIRVGVFRDPSGDPPGAGATRGLIRVGIQDVPDTSTTPEADGWRLYTRSNSLPNGQYVVMRLGRKYKMEQTTGFKSTDVGADV